LALSVAKAEKLRFIASSAMRESRTSRPWGDYNRALQDLFVAFQAKKQTCTWDEIRRGIVGRSYFMSGPFLEALESTDRVVLLIDELDKVDHAFEATLLEILSSGRCRFRKWAPSSDEASVHCDLRLTRNDF